MDDGMRVGDVEKDGIYCVIFYLFLRMCCI